MNKLLLLIATITCLGVSGQALRDLDLVTGTSAGIPVTEIADNEVELRIPIEGLTRTARLRRISIRSTSFTYSVASNGFVQEVPAPQAKTYRGTMPGDPGSWIAATIDGPKVSALIRLGDGTTWGIQPEGQAHIVYRESDRIVNGGSCGGTFPGLRPLHRPGQRNALARGGQPVIEIAADADFPFVQELGSVSNATTRVETLINFLDAIYESAVGANVELSNLIVRNDSASDPYTTNIPDFLLPQVADHWENVIPDQRADHVHLFSGRDFGGPTIGLAYRPGACTELRYAISWVTNSNNLLNQIGLVAHEVGHNLDAVHCDGDGDCRIMCTAIDQCDGLSGPSFGMAATDDIGAYIANNSCFGGAPAFTDCNGNGLDDALEIQVQPSLDCDENGQLDECDILEAPFLDCDEDNALDVCQITASPALDCNENLLLDSCELAKTRPHLRNVVALPYATTAWTPRVRPTDPLLLRVFIPQLISGGDGVAAIDVSDGDIFAYKTGRELRWRPRTDTAGIINELALSSGSRIFGETSLPNSGTKNYGYLSFDGGVFSASAWPLDGFLQSLVYPQNTFSGTSEYVSEFVSTTYETSLGTEVLRRGRVHFVDNGMPIATSPVFDATLPPLGDPQQPYFAQATAAYFMPETPSKEPLAIVLETHNVPSVFDGPCEAAQLDPWRLAVYNIQDPESPALAYIIDAQDDPDISINGCPGVYRGFRSVFVTRDYIVIPTSVPVNSFQYEYDGYGVVFARTENSIERLGRRRLAFSGGGGSGPFQPGQVRFGPGKTENSYTFAYQIPTGLAGVEVSIDDGSWRFFDMSDTSLLGPSPALSEGAYSSEIELSAITASGAISNPVGSDEPGDADYLGRGLYIFEHRIPDANNNGILDACEADLSSIDCNGNGIPDPRDIAIGTESDVNANGLPDSCDSLQTVDIDEAFPSWVAQTTSDVALENRVPLDLYGDFLVQQFASAASSTAMLQVDRLVNGAFESLYEFEQAAQLGGLSQESLVVDVQTADPLGYVWLNRSISFNPVTLTIRYTSFGGAQGPSEQVPVDFVEGELLQDRFGNEVRLAASDRTDFAIGDIDGQRVAVTCAECFPSSVLVFDVAAGDLEIALPLDEADQPFRNRLVDIKSGVAAIAQPSGLDSTRRRAIRQSVTFYDLESPDPLGTATQIMTPTRLFPINFDTGLSLSDDGQTAYLVHAIDVEGPGDAVAATIRVGIDGEIHENRLWGSDLAIRKVVTGGQASRFGFDGTTGGLVSAAIDDSSQFRLLSAFTGEVAAVYPDADDPTEAVGGLSASPPRNYAVNQFLNRALIETRIPNTTPPMSRFAVVEWRSLDGNENGIPDDVEFEVLFGFNPVVDDGQIDASDLLAFIQLIESGDMAADANRDGSVDAFDLFEGLRLYDEFDGY